MVYYSADTVLILAVLQFIFNILILLEPQKEVRAHQTRLRVLHNVAVLPGLVDSEADVQPCGMRFAGAPQ